jgi:hypothetical protein
MKSTLRNMKSQRGVMDILLAALLALGGLLLPAVQSGKSFNREVAVGSQVANQR